MRTPANVIQPGQDAFDYEWPWITPEAAYFLDNLLKPTDRVLDVGTGGSTLFFGRRCDVVVAIETEKRWDVRVADELKKHGLKHVKLIKTEREQLVETIGQQDPGFTVISVDTMVDNDRTAALREALKLAAPGCVIVMDNYTCGALWPRKQDVLEELGLLEREVHEFDLSGWSGRGTRILT